MNFNQKINLIFILSDIFETLYLDVKPNIKHQFKTNVQRAIKHNKVLKDYACTILDAQTNIEFGENADEIMEILNGYIEEKSKINP